VTTRSSLIGGGLDAALDVARRRAARARDRVDGSRAMLAASRTSRVGVASRARVARGV